MIKKIFALCSLLFALCISCTRSANAPGQIPAEPAALSSALPWAVLQPGEHPLWFQLTDNGPIHLTSIEEAIYSAALIPWPLALHVRFFHETDKAVVMAVNRYGFLKIAPNNSAAAENSLAGLALYRFPGSRLWRQYTIGGFAYYDNKPIALLYLDDRFLASAYPLPNPRTWTFNMKSNTLFPLPIPALEFFPSEEGWDVDTLRLGSDGFWYYRARRRGLQPQIRMKRTASLSQAGETISLDTFINSAARETEVFHPSLPPLPEGFAYTGIGSAGNSLFALWEEQAYFNIGAAGFVIINALEQ